MNRQQVHGLIDVERDRQNVKWGRGDGQWSSAPSVKLTVLTEEVGEVARAILEDDRPNLREELVQVAAVCMAWLEADFDE